MTKEQESDNKDKEVDNKTENLPPEESEVKAEESKEEVDPAKAKWMEDTGTLDNAYERSQGSAEEVEKYKKEAEDIRQEQETYQAQITAELKAVADKDPEGAAKLFGYELPKEETTEQPTVDPKELVKQATVEVRAQMEVEAFHQQNQDKFKDDDDWQNTRSLALSFIDKIDGEGKPYTIQTALRDATNIRHPDLIGDKAISEHLTSKANRASASESGDTSADSTDTGKINPDVEKHMEDLAPELGMNLDSEMRERIANRQSE